MSFDCLGIGDGLYQDAFGDLEVLLAPDSALEILPGGEGVGGLSVVTEQRTVAPCAFAAYSASSSIQTATSTPAVAQYSLEDFDIGSDYNNSTYTFTAPLDGIYMFVHNAMFDALGSGSNEFGKASIYKNGSLDRAARVVADSSASDSDVMATLTAVVSLATGDTVQPFVSVSVSNVLLGSNLQSSCFSGCLIKAT